MNAIGEGISATLPLRDTLTNGPSNGITAMFEMKGLEGAPAPVTDILSFTASGRGTFEIFFPSVGDYLYEITQITADTKNYTLDRRVYKVKVSVTYDGAGALQVAMALELAGVVNKPSEGVARNR